MNVPSVTINGGSRSTVTSPPLTAPSTTQTAKVASSATTGPFASNICAITIVPSTATDPIDRSMPDVRMMSVCPTARMPTTTDCCRISDTLNGLRNVFEIELNTMIATSSAMIGPSSGSRRIRVSHWRDAVGPGGDVEGGVGALVDAVERATF